MAKSIQDCVQALSPDAVLFGDAISGANLESVIDSAVAMIEKKVTIFPSLIMYDRKAEKSPKCKHKRSVRFFAVSFNYAIIKVK